MKTRLEKHYRELGVKLESNEILLKYLSFTELEQKELRQQYELFHMDLILGLIEIKRTDKVAFHRYVKALNDSGAELNFWGEKFEVYMHSKLLRGVPRFITKLRRGKDGLEPDLLFDFKDKELGLELTTLKFKTPPKNETQILSKLTEKVLEKNGKIYSKETCALVIDITNIVAFEKLFKFKISDIIEREFRGFSYLGKEINFGMIVFVNSIFQSQNDSLKHSLNPNFGFLSETKNIDSYLKTFLNVLFNNFRPNQDCDKMFYHLNI